MPDFPDFVQRSSSSMAEEDEHSSSSSVLLPRRNSFEQPGIGEPRAVAKLCSTESISLQCKISICFDTSDGNLQKRDLLWGDVPLQTVIISILARQILVPLLASEVFVSTAAWQPLRLPRVCARVP